MPYRVLIVDDEAPARKMIAGYLAAHANVEIVGACSNGRQAVAQINKERPDLVFLDVQMPALDGFEVVERLTHFPLIIFSTAHDEFALRAFDAGAIDYLLKPYDQARFDQAFLRVVDRLDNQPEKARAEIQDVVTALKQPDALTNMLFVRSREKIVPVKLDEIEWIEAAGDYAQLYVGNDSYLTGQNLGWFEKNLDASRFARVHRSAILAIAAIQQIKSDGEGGYIATVKSGVQVRISRTFAARLRALIV